MSPVLFNQLFEIACAIGAIGVFGMIGVALVSLFDSLTGK
jgi:hypothetical protein